MNRAAMAGLCWGVMVGHYQAMMASCLVVTVDRCLVVMDDRCLEKRGDCQTVATVDQYSERKVGRLMERRVELSMASKGG